MAAGKRRVLQARPLIAGHRPGNLGGAALRNIQGQANITLRAVHRQTAHQTIRIRQRLFMFESETEDGAEKDNPVIAAFRLHAQRQMIDAAVVIAQRWRVVQMKITGVDIVTGFD